MRASVIVITNRPRGLDLVVNGLSGQVEFDHYEARQKYNPEQNKIVTVRDVPVYKRLKGFELIVLDTADLSDPEAARVRRAEVQGASELAAASKDAIRLQLTKFGFKYVHEPHCPDPVREACARATGDVLIFMPDLAYAPPGFVEAHLRAQARAPGAWVSAVVTRKPVSVFDDWNYTGHILDAFAEVSGEPFETEGSLDLSNPFYRVQALSVPRGTLLPGTLVQGYELNLLALSAGHVTTLPGEAATLMRLAPPADMPQEHESDAKGYEALGIKRRLPDGTPSQGYASAAEKPWYKRLFA